MKMYFYIVTLFLIVYVKSETNCNDIVPSKASDCVLSSTDKETAKYCCYEYDKTDNEKECEALNEELYQFALAFFGEFPDKYEFDCSGSSTKGSLNSSSFIELGIVFFFIFIMF